MPLILCYTQGSSLASSSPHHTGATPTTTQHTLQVLHAQSAVLLALAAAQLSTHHHHTAWDPASCGASQLHAPRKLSAARPAHSTRLTAVRKPFTPCSPCGACLPPLLPGRRQTPAARSCRPQTPGHQAPVYGVGVVCYLWGGCSHRRRVLFMSGLIDLWPPCVECECACRPQTPLLPTTTTPATSSPRRCAP